MVLDCESVESTVLSVSKIFKCSEDDVIDTLKSVDLNFVWVKYRGILVSHVYKVFLRKFGKPSDLTSVCWFHLSRTASSTTFDEGILPLNAVLPYLWETLYSIFAKSVQEKRLRQLYAEGVSSDPRSLYIVKTRNNFLGGPFAMLVKAIAWRAEEVGNHDFLKLPEILEDICDEYEKRFGESIQEVVETNLKPCIVKFESENRLEPRLIMRALNYACFEMTKEGLSPLVLENFSDHNDVIDCSGAAITREQILKVEFV
jgi:hypothetical protein